MRNFFFQQVTHDLANPAAAESRNDPFLIRIQPGAFYIPVGCRRPVVPHQYLGRIQAKFHKRNGRASLHHDNALASSG